MRQRLEAGANAMAMTSALIEQIRRSSPSRNVTGRRGNVRDQLGEVCLANLGSTYLAALVIRQKKFELTTNTLDDRILSRIRLTLVRHLVLELYQLN